MNDVTLDDRTPDLRNAAYQCTRGKHGTCVVWPAHGVRGDLVQVHIPVQELSDASVAAGGEPFGVRGTLINRALRDFKSRIQNRVSNSAPVEGRIVLGLGSLRASSEPSGTQSPPFGWNNSGQDTANDPVRTASERERNFIADTQSGTIEPLPPLQAPSVPTASTAPSTVGATLRSTSAASASLTPTITAVTEAHPFLRFAESFEPLGPRPVPAVMAAAIQGAASSSAAGNLSTEVNADRAGQVGNRRTQVAV